MRGSINPLLPLAGSPQKVAKACNVTTKKVHNFLADFVVHAKYYDIIKQMVSDNGFLMGLTCKVDPVMSMYCDPCGYYKNSRGGAYWSNGEGEPKWLCRHCAHAISGFVGPTGKKKREKKVRKCG